MKRTIGLILVVVGLSVMAIAQAAPEMPDAVKVKLLTARDALHVVQRDVKDAEGWFKDAQIQIMKKNGEFQQLKTQEAEAQKVLDRETDEAYKAAGLDRSKYDLDLKTLAFSPKKPDPAPAEKK